LLKSSIRIVEKYYLKRKKKKKKMIKKWHKNKD